MDQNTLIDQNLYKTISRCFINKKSFNTNEIFVIYTDGTRESIWTYDPMKQNFDHHLFLGRTKIEAVFYCDRKTRNVHIAL